MNQSKPTAESRAFALACGAYDDLEEANARLTAPDVQGREFWEGRLNTVLDDLQSLIDDLAIANSDEKYPTTNLT